MKFWSKTPLVLSEMAFKMTKMVEIPFFLMMKKTSERGSFLSVTDVIVWHKEDVDSHLPLRAP